MNRVTQNKAGYFSLLFGSACAINFEKPLPASVWHCLHVLVRFAALTLEAVSSAGSILC